MLVRASSGSGGGGNEIIYGTTDGIKYEATWGFDAEVVIVIFRTGTTKQIIMIDTTTLDYWLANDVTSSGYWKSGSMSGNVNWNVTKRSVSIVNTSGANIFDAIPLTNKPEGYFT